MTDDKRGLEVSPGPQIEVKPIEDQQLHLCLPADLDICFSCRQFGHFAKEYSEKGTSLGKVNYGRAPYPSTNGASISMKVTQMKGMKKKLWQQCVIMLKPTL